MHRIRRLGVITVSVMILVTASGCFLPFFGGDDEPKLPESSPSSGAAAQATSSMERDAAQNPGAAADAIRRAEQAVANQQYETAAVEYNRALRADSSNVSTYFALAKLHRQLSEQYRADGKLDEALREHTRAVSVLSAYVTKHLEPAAAAAASTPPGSAAPPAAPASQTTPSPAKADSTAPSGTPPSAAPSP